MSKIAKLSLLAAGVYCAALGVTHTAHACGGTFCDGGNGMPVDQTGETIVFAQGGGFVEAHVQINYDGGDASQFSWIVPVPQVPEIQVGSLQLINNLRAATVPTYSTSAGDNECNESGISSGGGFISNPDGGGASIDPEPEVLEISTAGAFDYAILQGGTSTTIMQWLEDNGYAPNPLAPDLLDAYIDEGSVFVAFQLNHLAGIEDLHPVVIRYEGSEPCIPLRLTAVAAREDMDIRAIFLGEDRVLPTNYRHVRLNAVRLNWLGLASNYADVVSMALDEAGGRAFVTEYAGDSDVVATDTLDTNTLNPDAFAKIDPLSVVDVLVSQDLMSCTDTCEYRHELVPLLLREFMPPPAGVDAETFYACLTCYEELADTTAWDADAFADRYREFITDPMDHATDLLNTWPYLTRLYSRLSPHEMLSDPMFAEVEGLGAVPNLRGAQRNTDACCTTSMTLPDGAVVEIDQGWPEWTQDMPYAAVIQQYQPAGPPAIETDNRDEINAQLSAFNAGVLSRIDCDETSSGGHTTGGGDSTTDPTSPTSGPDETSGVVTSGPDDGPSTSSQGSAAGGSGSTSGGNGGALDDGGGCRVGGTDSTNSWWGLMLLLGLGAVRRRGNEA